MYLLSFSVKNIRAFKDEVTLDLRPNVNGIENDIKSLRFKKVGKQYFSPVVGITSANAMGKTSLLESIMLFSKMIAGDVIEFDLFTKYNSLSMSKNNIQYFDIMNTNKIVKVLKETDEYIFLNIGPINIFTITNLNLYDHQENIRKILDANSFILSEQKSKAVIIYIDIINNILKELCEEKFNKWVKSKRYPNLNSEMKMIVYDELTNKEIKIVLNDNGNTVYCSMWENDNLKTAIDRELGARVISFISGFLDFIPGKISTSSFTLPGGLKVNSPENRHGLFSSFLGIVKTFFNLHNDDEIIRKAISLLSVVDKNVEDIIFSDEKNRLNSQILKIKYQDGATSTLDNISNGTIKFIELFCFLSLIYERNEGVLIIDEIESHLHISLVELFKEIFYSTKKNIMLIFSSHNPYVFENMSKKQVFYIDDNEERTIKKVSSKLNNNNSTTNVLLKKLIGSHPSDFDISSVIDDIIDREYNE